jgi:hypothetical protein
MRTPGEELPAHELAWYAAMREAWREYALVTAYMGPHPPSAGKFLYPRGKPRRKPFKAKRKPMSENKDSLGELRTKRAIEGKCCYCTKPIIPGYKICQAHRVYNIEQKAKRELRRDRREQGLCIHCGEGLESGVHAACEKKARAKRDKRYLDKLAEKRAAAQGMTREEMVRASRAKTTANLMYQRQGVGV